jgi:hypothetical protein
VDAVNAAHFQRYRDTPEVAILFGDPELVLPIQETVTSVLSGDPAFTRFAARTQLQLYPSSIQPPAPKPDDVTDAALEVAVSSVGHAGALDYARCVAIGSRGLPDPVLVEAAARLGRSADLAWATSLTSYSRAEVNERGRTQDRVVALAARDVAVLQDAWQAYAVVLFHRMGGYVRLQTDRYYMRHRTLNEPLGCPVCGGPANRVEMRLPTNQTSTRLLIECVSCATVLDAAVPLDMSRLVIAGSVTVGKSLGAVLEWSAISSVGLGGVPIRAVAVLEPFAKSVAGQPTMVIARGVTPTEAASSGRIAGELRLPDLIIPADTPCGVHYLNVLLLIGAIPAVIRTHVLLVADPKLTGPAPHGAQPAPLPLVEIT